MGEGGEVLFGGGLVDGVIGAEEECGFQGAGVAAGESFWVHKNNVCLWRPGPGEGRG